MTNPMKSTRPRKPRPKRSLEDLREAKAHVNFELSGFMSAIIGIANSMKQPPDFMTVPLSTVRQALIDSMTIHARSLIHFAYPDGQVHTDDVLAEDFIPDWSSKRPPWPDALVDVRSRVATEVAHLSYRRIGLTEEEVLKWDLNGLLGAVAKAMTVFGANLPEELADPPVDVPAASGPPKPPGAFPFVIPRWPAPSGGNSGLPPRG